MNFHQPHSVEEYIVANLQQGPQKVVHLIELIKKQRGKGTKQGVYAALRNLKRQEIIVTHTKSASLSTVWIDRMNTFFAMAAHHYTNKNEGSNAFLGLEEGEKLQYYFKNPVTADAFWSHAFYALVETSSPKNAVVLYNPHDWFLLARTENEKFLLDYVVKRGQRYYLVSGNNDPLDKTISRHFDGKMAQCEFLEEPIFPKNNYYLNIIGDFVIEVWIDGEIAERIDEFYKKTEVIDEVGKLELDSILAIKGKTKLVISRKARKAHMLRRKLEKYFF